MRGIGKVSRRPRRFARATEGGIPRISGGVARGSRCPASPRHALLAENLGMPSLWVIISTPWYQAPMRARRRRAAYSEAARAASDSTTESTVRRSAAASPPGVWVRV